MDNTVIVWSVGAWVDWTVASDVKVPQGCRVDELDPGPKRVPARTFW